MGYKLRRTITWSMSRARAVLSSLTTIILCLRTSTISLVLPPTGPDISRLLHRNILLCGLLARHGFIVDSEESSSPLSLDLTGVNISISVVEGESVTPCVPTRVFCTVPYGVQDPVRIMPRLCTKATAVWGILIVTSILLTLLEGCTFSACWMPDAASNIQREKRSLLAADQASLAATRRSSIPTSVVALPVFFEKSQLLTEFVISSLEDFLAQGIPTDVIEENYSG
ncbi:hypothetical protein BDV18DRAFT_40977 [Aspergillus unguis]